MDSFVVVGILFFLAGPILAIIALVRLGSLDQKIWELKREVERLSGGEAIRPVAQVAEPTPASQPEPVPESKPETKESMAWPAKTADETVAENLPPAAPVPVPARRDVESALASRWFVWVGGVAIALGGLLFVKYAHDNGLIPPALRIIIGLIFGGALVAAGEWLRRRDDVLAKSYVPAALSAAGLAIGFGSVYAAYALYDLLSPTACFPALVAIGLAALWLSLRQGPLIAALGLAGSYGAPALVPSDFPNVWGFFVFLLVILAAALLLLRKRPWWWLGFAALGASAAWTVLWLNGFFATDQILPIALFALLAGAAAAALPVGRGILAADMGHLSDPSSLKPPMQIAIAGLAAMTIMLAAMVLTSGHDVRALIAFAVAMVAITGFGWWRDGMVGAPLAAALASLVLLMLWPEVGFHDWAMDERGFWSTVPGQITPPKFVTAMLVALVFFATAGVAGTLLRAEKRPWSALAAGAAVLFLFGAWARADHVLGNAVWALIGGVLAVVLGATADRMRVAASRASELLLAGVAVLLLFAADRLFDGVAFTLVIAALSAGFAFLSRRITLPWVGVIATALASLAAVRLFVGREFWGEPLGLLFGSHWVLYGYGVPALLAWVSSRWLRQESFARHGVALEGIALGLAISLVSLELRVLIGGGITRDTMGLLEMAAHGLTWLGAAYGLAYRQSLFSSLVSLWGARILLVAGSAVFLIALTVRNPVVTGDIVEGGRVINALWLAYLAPVPLLALLARKLDGLGLGQLRNATGLFALALVMAFVTLLVKRQFQDFTIDIEFLSDAESYAVSLAWLVLAIAIFIAGIRLDRQNIRYGGLAVMVLTVLKVFIFDLSDLGGLWRIASLIGLGLCLIGVGWLYTRFVLKPKTSP